MNPNPIIEVQEVSKLYGTQKALDGVSFVIEKPGVVGLLGPNGAGKSTLMKILCGYLSPSSGRATVCGYDTCTQAMQVRRHVGYLPEHNPLYDDMYVREYLTFVGELYGLERLKARVEEVLERVGFGTESHKPIGDLSKGYRQRVGLAQALLPDPDVLILDEPTTGLDPNQIEEIRVLLRQMGQEKTLILSTHIMQEAQAVCERIVLIDKGRLVADAPTRSLLDGQGGACLHVEFSAALDAAQRASLENLPFVARTMGEGTVCKVYLKPMVIRASDAPSSDADPRAALFQWAVEQGLTILTLRQEADSLENVFHSLTRKTPAGL
ncbi:MAG: ATP-binding cassette domain-containing protein [Bacteroidales bacterium]|nr:ATP-binding cassette domain-containing protein [Bacteroidales bacterium]